MISNDNPIDDSSVPETPESAIRAPNFRAAGQAIGDGLGDSTWIEKKLDKLQKWIADTIAYLLVLLLPKFVNIIGYFAAILVKVREQMDENMAKLASEGLSDLFGQEEQSAAFQQIGDHASRKQVAEVLGRQILRGIVGDTAPSAAGGVPPSDAAAKAFLTRMAELTVEGWFESIVTGIISEHPLEKLGDLKEQVARTFGFGRIAPRVLRPAIDVLVTNPFKEQLHKQYRPTLLSEGHAVELYLRKKLTKEQMSEILARQGYSDTDIDHQVALSEKFLGANEAAFMWLAGAWSEEEARQYLEDRGYSTGIAALILQHEKQRQILAPRQEALKAATESYVHRFIDVAEFTKYVNAAVVDEDIRHEIIVNASSRRELNRSHLTEIKAEAAVIDGFWTIQQYTEHLARRGYNDEDQLTMQLLVQQKISEMSDKTKARKDAAAARASAKAAALAKAQARQAQLDQARSHRALSLAQVHRAYVQGRLTLPQLHDFLVQEKQAPDDIDTLLTLAQADRADYEQAQAKKARANEKLAVTSLSTSQLEHLVRTGTLSLDDYQKTLTKEGVSDGDIALLVKAAQVDLAAAIAAKAHRDAIAARTAEHGLSLAQWELAVRQGLRTMDQFKQFLAANKYGPADQASLVGLVQDRIDADKAAELKKEEHAAKLAHKGISLPALELAVIDGLRPLGDYQQALLDSGVVPADVHTLVSLLQRKIDDRAAAAARKAELALKAATHGISLVALERAARLGVVSKSFYQQALTKAHVPPEDQAVLLALLDADIARVQVARAKEAAAAAKLHNKPVTLALLKHSVLLGIRTIADYKLALHQEGFDDKAVDLMGELLADEMAQRKAAEERKAALDAKRSVKEIARADLEKAVQEGIKTLPDYAAFLREQGYDEEDQGILYDLLAKKVAG